MGEYSFSPPFIGRIQIIDKNGSVMEIDRCSIHDVAITNFNNPDNLSKPMVSFDKGSEISLTAVGFVNFHHAPAITDSNWAEMILNGIHKNDK